MGMALPLPPVGGPLAVAGLGLALGLTASAGAANVLWGSATVQGYPADRRYTEVTLIYTAKRPPYYQVVNGKVVPTYPPALTVPAL
jgi:hypothetical protein